MSETTSPSSSATVPTGTAPEAKASAAISDAPGFTNASAARPSRPTAADSHRMPGNIGERLASGVEHFELNPPEGGRDPVLAAIRACAAQGLTFNLYEVQCGTPFATSSGREYVHYVYDITIITRANYVSDRPSRRSVYVRFTGETTGDRAGRQAMADFLTVQFGFELPREFEAAAEPTPPTAPLRAKESAARKYRLIEEIERTASHVTLKQLLEQNRQEISWLWKADRGEVTAAAELRLRDLAGSETEVTP